MLKRYFSYLLFLFTTNTYCQIADHKEEPSSFSDNSLTISTNIPTWVLGIPSFGLGYKISDRNELLVESSFSYWNFERQGTPHYWRSWSVSPQFRSYINHDGSTYLGAQVNVGEYNISNQQGKYLGGGLSVGKQYYAGKNLLIDLGLTLGYLRFTDRANYIYHNDIFYTNRVKEDKNYWGPTAVSVKLSRKVN